jgi:hypothetical protein
MISKHNLTREDKKWLAELAVKMLYCIMTIVKLRNSPVDSFTAQTNMHLDLITEHGEEK